ncbi:MAG TPA: DUF1330 domain-containing protein [Sporichthya sp.]|nr:DUF1330 domain-containing protein [Sporichthya sp.]
MPAYFVFRNRIIDDQALQAYIPKAVGTMGPFGAELVVLDEKSEVKEGSSELPRTVILKFESRDRAEAWYNSAEYQAVLPERLGASEGYAVLVDGFEG